MSWHFSLALEAAYSAERFSDGEPFAQWKSMPSAPDDSCSGKMKDIFHRSPFGMMFVPSTDGLGGDVLTWFLAGFPARIFPQLERARASKESEAASGNKWLVSLAKLDPVTHWWKIPQCLLFEDMESSLETWPRWGSMQDGECFHAATSVEFIYESESGYSLPTTGKNEFKGSSKKRFVGSPDFRGAKMSEGLRTCETDPIYLNPSFAELVMMWPMEWTGSQPLETAKFQEWLSSHGKPSQQIIELDLFA